MGSTWNHNRMCMCYVINKCLLVEARSYASLFAICPRPATVLSVIYRRGRGPPTVHVQTGGKRRHRLVSRAQPWISLQGKHLSDEMSSIHSFRLTTDSKSTPLSHASRPKLSNQCRFVSVLVTMKMHFGSYL